MRNHLVPNPIYDGPFYDTVQPSLETLENNTLRNLTTKDEIELNIQPYLIPATSLTDSEQPNVVRYVDQQHSVQSPLSPVSNQYHVEPDKLKEKAEAKHVQDASSRKEGKSNSLTSIMLIVIVWVNFYQLL